MNRLREARFRRRISQLRLFKVTGVWPSKISAIENDLLPPTGEQKKKLSKALNYPIEWLFPIEDREGENAEELR
jgi:transcriptional regulator with XRE-family HTH domain